MFGKLGLRVTARKGWAHTQLPLLVLRRVGMGSMLRLGQGTEECPDASLASIMAGQAPWQRLPCWARGTVFRRPSLHGLWPRQGGESETP